MRALILRIALLIAFFSWQARITTAQESHTLSFDDLDRDYLVIPPDDYDDAQAYPLMIVLHGAGGNGVDMFAGTGLSEYGNRNGVITVYPNGNDAVWWYLDRNELNDTIGYTDDIGFLRALVAQVSTDYNVDAERIYLAGFSAGGLMTIRAGCDARDLWAGLIIVGATYSFELAQHCLDDAPLPTLLIIGTEDTSFPAAGYVRFYGEKMRSSFSLTQLRGYINDRHACRADPTAERVERTETPIIRESYRICSRGADVDLYVIVDFPHAWPTAAPIVLSDGTAGTIEDAMFAFMGADGVQEATAQDPESAAQATTEADD